jgi:hypothetical protein
VTEVEWWECEDPDRLLQFVGRQTSARRIRLALCGCLRDDRVWPLLIAPSSRHAVEIGEAFADGAANRKTLGEARKKANAVAGKRWRTTHRSPAAAYLANFVCLQDRNLLSFLHLPDGYLRQLRPPADLFRDVFGNPFSPVVFDPVWRTSDVRGLARGIYDDRAFDRLPILADALIEAGCDDDVILGHCRGPGPHVRGCWVVDLVLGKE